MRFRWLATLVGLSVVGLIQAQDFSQRIVTGKKPNLVVVISIDQFRADYVRRFAHLFLPAKDKHGVGGFQYLWAKGSYFADCQHDHFPTYTGPGHAAILTGTGPFGNGIVGNAWFDSKQAKRVYCVDDPRYKVVGAPAGSRAKPMGPLNLKSSTVGDELKLATGGHSKVVSIALKDRASILMGGHAQDVALWFDASTGSWISSTAYAKSGVLPGWVSAINEKKVPYSYAGKIWNKSLPEVAYALTTESKGAGNPGYGLHFPHKLTSDPKEVVDQFDYTPWANFFVLQTAAEAISQEGLGRHSVPDLLAINLSTNDYIGHSFGPNSPEVLDLTVQTDKALSEFFNAINASVEGGLDNTVIVLTADHGISPIPSDANALNIPSEWFGEKSMVDSALSALDKAYGKHDWLKNGDFVEPYLCLSPVALQQVVEEHKATSIAEVRRTAAEAVRKVPQVYAAYTYDDIIEGQLPLTSVSTLITHACYPELSGDILVVQKPFHLIGGSDSTGTSHGTPWPYDLQVPLFICGPGVRAGVWTEPVKVTDIAPTLSQLLGIIYPSACSGKVLPHVLN